MGLFNNYLDKYLTKLRKMLILYLAGKRLPVILNCKVYDHVIKFNKDVYGDILTSNCNIEKIEKHIQDEAAVMTSCARKGIMKRGNVFVLSPWT